MDRQTEKEILSLVEKNFNDIAKDFNETRKKFLWPELLKFTAEVVDGQKILDVGCGNGRLLEGLKNKNINYLGVDRCAKLLELAKQNYHQAALKPKINFILGDIRELGLIPEINFDKVFCIAVLHHLPGERLRLEALRQLKNKISDQGEIILTVWNMWRQKKYWKIIFKFMMLKLIGKNKMDARDIIFDWRGPNNLLSQRYYHAFTKRELKKLIKKSGLKINRSYQDHFNYYFILKK